VRGHAGWYLAAEKFPDPGRAAGTQAMWHPEAARLLMLRGPIFERVPTVSNASPWVGARALADQACEQRSTPQERGPERRGVPARQRRCVARPRRHKVAASCGS
jgi:hypothetical protein